MPRREVILTTLANRDAEYGGVEGHLSWPVSRVLS